MSKLSLRFICRQHKFHLSWFQIRAFYCPAATSCCQQRSEYFWKTHMLLHPHFDPLPSILIISHVFWGGVIKWRLQPADSFIWEAWSPWSWSWSSAEGFHLRVCVCSPTAPSWNNTFCFMPVIAGRHTLNEAFQLWLSLAFHVLIRFGWPWEILSFIETCLIWFVTKSIVKEKTSIMSLRVNPKVSPRADNI